MIKRKQREETIQIQNVALYISLIYCTHSLQSNFMTAPLNSFYNYGHYSLLYVFYERKSTENNKKFRWILSFCCCWYIFLFFKVGGFFEEQKDIKILNS